MRWYWIDRFVEFHGGRRATAVKLVTLSEDHLHSQFPNYPVLPNALVTEGMGQTGMLLAWEAIHYSQLVLLAKVSAARFYFDAVPGDRLTYTVTLDAIRKEGISVTATSRLDDRLQGEAELLFARFANARTGSDSPAAGKLAEMMHVSGRSPSGAAPMGAR